MKYFQLNVNLLLYHHKQHHILIFLIESKNPKDPIFDKCQKQLEFKTSKFANLDFKKKFKQQ